MMDLNRIKDIVEVYFGIKDISLRTRKANYVLARTVYVVVARKITKFPMTVVGDIVGLHHSSVVHMINKIYESWLAFPVAYSKELNAVNTIIEDIANTDKIDYKLEDAKDLLIQAYRAKNLLKQKEIAELERIIEIRNERIKYLEKYAPIL